MNVMVVLMPMMDTLIKKKHDDIAEHEVKINSLQAGVRNNECAHGSLAQYSRRENLRLSGVPKSESDQETKDTCVMIIQDIAHAMKFEVDKSSFVDMHRLGKKTHGGKPRQLIVRITSRLVRENFLLRRRSLKDTEKFKTFLLLKTLHL
jgi:hypothetical protein